MSYTLTIGCGCLVYVASHPHTKMLDGRERLFAPRRRDTGVLLREVEVVGVRVAEAAPIARLPSQPVEESLEVRQGGVERRLAQPLTPLLAPLLRQAPLERDGLLDVERLEVPTPGRLLEASNRLGGSIDAGLAVAVRLLQVGEVPVLDLLTGGIPLCDGAAR